MANLMLVLGLAACVRPLKIRRATLTAEIPYSLTAALLVAFLANIHVFFQGYSNPVLSQLDGLVLLASFGLFLVYCFKSIKRVNAGGVQPDHDEKATSTKYGTMMLIGGVALVAIGGSVSVEGALFLADSLGVREGIVGLTIMALGTSAPELVVSTVAAYLGKVELAVCNVVGSNIINLLFVLGMASTMGPLPFDPNSNQDLVVLVMATLGILSLALFSTTPRLTRPAGSLMLVSYAGYILLSV